MARPWDTRPIRAEVARRREALLSGLDGRAVVLDARTGPPDGADGPPGHVVSIGWLALQDDLDAACARLRELVGPAGWLHVLEPTSGVGFTARAQRAAATVASRRTGWRVDRDVPGAIRRAGLVLTDLERFSMPVPSPVLRPWIQGRARVRPEVPVEGRS